MEKLWPIPLDHITQFIAYQSCLGIAPSTVKCYVSALSFYNKLDNCEDFTQHFVVKKMLDGMTRLRARGSDCRYPITYELLRKIVEILPSVCISKYETILFACSFCMAFFAFLRSSEICSNSGNCVINHAIKTDNVQISDSHIELILESS